jgi:hypothetical protein
MMGSWNVGAYPTFQYSIIPCVQWGRLAQLDRALVSGTKGRGFDPRIARHLSSL